MNVDARRATPPTTPIAEAEPPCRGPSRWGFGFLGLAVLVGTVPLGGFLVEASHHPQWVFFAMVAALGFAAVFGIIGGVMLLRRLPSSTWGRLISVSLVFLLGFLVLAGANGIQLAYGELIAG
ncbi:MAG TPA: hypothetical protein DCG14_11160 [Phycisphaerales bacterium]|nr:hypothetical protein [Phycisphaerales bacterium]